jgi:aspartate/methionine/tyrosine aminotransferase
LLATPQAWPYLTLAAALAGVVSGVHSARSTINLALAVTERAVRVAVVSDVSGPASWFLEHARVALSSGHVFGPGGAGHVRLNFATSRAILAEAVSRMGRAVQRSG